MIFDTHTHLNVAAFADDAAETIQRANELGVKKMAVVGFDTETIEKGVALSREYPMIYNILGWHPTEAGSYSKEVEDYVIQQLTTQKKVVALGEIGLDYHWMKDSKEVQAKVFRRQIAIAKELNLPISIHTRDAIEDTYEILKEAKIQNIGGIMHSFSGDTEWMKKFLDLGMHISLSGVVTFKKATELHEVAKEVPLDSLLVETDAPYLAPVPYRGKRNEPGYTFYVVQEIAKLRETPIEEVEKQTYENAMKLFRIEENA